MSCQLLESLKLCTSLSLLSPRDTCNIRCCCKSLQALHFSWLEYKHTIVLDISKPSVSWWLWRNITSIRSLKLVKATQQQVSCLLEDAKALAAFAVQDSTLSTVPCLPPTLKDLNILHSASVVQLPELPASLEVLHLDRCPSLLELPSLEHTAVAEVFITNCPRLDSIPHLPGTLVTLECSRCTALRSIGRLPNGLRSIQAVHCKSLQVGVRCLASADITGVWE